MKFTKQQIEDWVEYENVRASGAFNMWFPEARKATGLGNERYGFVMAHFSELKKAHEAGKLNASTPPLRRSRRGTPRQSQ